jgi:putative cell wall-binding protein
LKVKRSLALVLSVLLIMTAVIPAAVAADENLDRIFGADRFLTAVEIALEGWEDGADVVVLANGLNFPDALAGVPLAAALDAPILLTGAAELNEDTAAAIEELEAEEVIILGGEAAVSKAVFEELEDMGLEVERVFGDGRWDTAVAIAEKLAEVLDVDEFETAVVVYARNFPDALAAASYAAINEMPIFLTDTDEVSEPTADALEAFNVEEVLVVGGKSVISDDVVEELDAERIAGDDRFDTSVELAKYFELDTELFYIATGMGFSDAIAGAALAAKQGTGILLVGSSLPASVRDFLYSGKVMEAVVFGGANAVSATVLNNVSKNLFNPFEINVESVKHINKEEVEITFYPLADDIEDATIEVIDNKGNVVKVESQNLVANEEGATFVFTTKLTDNPEGVWIIHGFEYDVDTVNIIAKVNSAASQVAFYNALVDGGFENVKAANAAKYFAEGETVVFETLEEIQEFIDEVNADALTDEEEKELVEALEDALGNEVLVLSALKASWARVNADNLSVYIQAISSGRELTVTTFDGIQDEIDSINYGIAKDLVDDAKASADRDDYDDAVEAIAFVKADDEDDDRGTVDKPKKETLQETLDFVLLIVKVKEASTAAQFKNAYDALAAYYEADEDRDPGDFGTEPFFYNLRDKYRLAVKDADDEVVDQDDIEALIVEVNNVERARLLNIIADFDNDDESDDFTSTDAVLKALQNFAAYVDEDDFDIEDVHTSKTRLALYREYLADGFDYDDVDELGDPIVVPVDPFAGLSDDFTAAQLMDAIEAVALAIEKANDYAVQQPLDLIAGFEDSEDYNYTADGLLKLLKDTELGLTNVVDANAKVYFEDFEDEIIEAAEEGRTALKNLIENINQVQVLANTTSITVARGVLGYIALTVEGSEGANIDDYIELTSAQKTEIATLFINDAKWGENKFVDGGRSVTNLKSYKDINDVVTDVNALITAYEAVIDGINDADTTAEMRTALRELEYKAYDDLTDAEKIDVASYVVENFPMTNADEPERVPFKTFAAIQALIDEAIVATK